MKTARRTVSLFLAALLVVAVFAIPAAAAETAEIQPRARICDCGGKVMVTYGAWSTKLVEDETPCTHRPHGTDLHYVSQRIVTEKCQLCGEGFTYLEYKRWTECHGYYG